nr:Rpn family recombination-promoting nuclease/putative transposase [uncultured Acetatifactor sp.]
MLYKNFKNDISFEVEGRVLVLGEHQSTVNPNMPLRCLMYVGRAYEQLVEKKARYRTMQVKIPTPEFYTFYNGTEEFPQEQELRLSDAFLDAPGGNSAELTVKVININSHKAHIILEKCGILREYSLFVDKVRKNSIEEDAIKKAINECIQQGILSDYLKRKGSEVTNMLIAEYDYEEDIQVKQQEAMQKGWEKGLEKGLILSAQIFKAIQRNPGFADKQIAETVGCSPDDVENARKAFGL